MKRIITSILFFISLGLLIYSSYEIITWYLENKNNNSAKAHTIEITKIEEKEEDKYPYITTDFTNLISENNKVKGWIQVPNTNINYPVLQHTDNDYYLNHNFYEKYSSAGWVFLDYRNNIEIDDDNIILYAHNRLDNSMFGTLKNTLNEEWLNNNKYIFFNTLNKNNTYEVFSVYTINANDFNAMINFNDENEYQNYIDDIKNKSIINLNVNISKDDKIITLYTCNKNNVDRTILHAKLIQSKSNS